MDVNNNNNNNNKVVCGWKGCENMFSSMEGMNVHVQADHMLYRVLLQTEYQGRTHLNVYDHQQTQENATKPTVYSVPLDIQSSGPITPATIAPATPIIEEPITPAIISSPIQFPVTHPVGVDEVIPSQLPIGIVSTSATPSIRSPATEHKREYSPSPPRPSKKRARKPTSKFWTYTDHLTYRCNVISCTSEFNNPDTARHHFYSAHSLEAPASPDGPSTSTRRSSVSGFSSAAIKSHRKRKCTRPGCTRFFFSEAALNRHDEQFHAETDVNNNQDIDEYKDDEEDQSSDYERDDEMKEIPHKDKEHFYY